jgi:hypothetical protein
LPEDEEQEGLVIQDWGFNLLEVRIGIVRQGCAACRQ